MLTFFWQLRYDLYMNATHVPQITTKEAARLCNVCQKTIRQWVKSGTLRASKVGGRLRTTSDWINEMSRPIPVDSNTATKRSLENGGHQAAKRDLLLRFGIGKKMPHS
jgi:excisionase family DNA binding protein